MKAVIDTNGVFVGLVNHKGAPFKILRRFFHQKFDWINSQETLEEYQGVLAVSQKIKPTSLHIFLYLLHKNSTFVQIPGSLRVCKDPDDAKFSRNGNRNKC